MLHSINYSIPMPGRFQSSPNWLRQASEQDVASGSWCDALPPSASPPSYRRSESSESIHDVAGAYSTTENDSDASMSSPEEDVVDRTPLAPTPRVATSSSVFAAAHEAFLRRKAEEARASEQRQMMEDSIRPATDDEMRAYRMQKQRYFRAINLVPRGAALPDTHPKRNSPSEGSFTMRRSPSQFHSSHHSPFDGFAPSRSRGLFGDEEDVDAELCLDDHVSMKVRSAPIDIPRRKGASPNKRSFISQDTYCESDDLDSVPGSVCVSQSPFILFDL